MRPLPYTNSGAGIAFFVVLGIFVVLEQRVRLRSWLNRRGSRADQGSLLVVIVSVLVGVGGGFAVAADMHQAGIPQGRWPMFVVGLVLMCAGIAIRQSSTPSAARAVITLFQATRGGRCSAATLNRSLRDGASRPEQMVPGGDAASPTFADGSLARAELAP